jgi:hypothetical protein
MKLRITFSTLLLSTIILAACVSAEQQDANRLKIFTDLQGKHNSCESAKLLTHEVASQQDITSAMQITAIKQLNFNVVMPGSANPCPNSQIQAYHVGYGDRNNTITMIGPFYARHMTLTAAKQDPDIFCRTTFTQVYQPPLRQGGAGRIMNIPAGFLCTPRK